MPCFLIASWLIGLHDLSPDDLSLIGYSVASLSLGFAIFLGIAPFHTWLMPRRHSSGFDAATPEEMKDLAHALRDLMAKYYSGLDDPNYNMVLRSVPVRTGETSYYHWYVAIVPRMGRAAGFELGSGMFINSSIPEEDAEFLRNVKQ